MTQTPTPSSVCKVCGGTKYTCITRDFPGADVYSHIASIHDCKDYLCSDCQPQQEKFACETCRDRGEIRGMVRCKKCRPSYEEDQIRADERKKVIEGAILKIESIIPVGCFTHHEAVPLQCVICAGKCAMDSLKENYLHEFHRLSKDL